MPTILSRSSASLITGKRECADAIMTSKQESKSCSASIKTIWERGIMISRTRNSAISITPSIISRVSWSIKSFCSESRMTSTKSSRFFSSPWKKRPKRDWKKDFLLASDWLVECSSFIKNLIITVGLTNKKYHIYIQSAKISIKCGDFL